MRHTRNSGKAFVILVGLANAYGQTALRCTPTATNLINHAEGLSEPSGDIVLSCFGGASGTIVTSNITLNYNVPVTNRISAAGNPDALITVDTGLGPVALNISPIFLSASTLAFNGVSFTLSTAASATIRINNVRVAAALSAAGRPIQAQISTTALPLSNAVVTVATSATGLLATYANSGIACTGSPLPAALTLQNLFNTGTNFASTRVTEGFASAFVPKDPTSDSGTRILLKYSNFPAGARVLIPDLVAGNDALAPTAAGDIGGVRSGGAYSPSGGGTLLLARVAGADSNGVGGAPVATASQVPAGVQLTGVTDVPLTNGSGTAVYEVIDANPSFQESAQFPTFIGLTLAPNQSQAIATETLSFAPSSNITTAASGVAVPRFAATPPGNDCSALGDCGAQYFPVLTATAANLQFSVSATGNVLTQYILVNNTGGGLLNFVTSVTYQGNAANWLSITNQGGNTNHTTLRLDASPIGLAQGTYSAVVLVDAAGAGKQSFTFTFAIGPPQIAIGSIVNAASFQPGPLVAGSLATIKGTNLAGKAVSVTFNGIACTILYNDPQQINLQVPASLASVTLAQVIVSVDGNSSAPATVQLAAINPGIFGVLNQDNTINSSSNPAIAGTVLQIFATGLISPVSSGPVVTGLGNQGIATLYSGAFPNGLQQVNAQLPPNAASIPGFLVICGTASGGQLSCSQTVTIYVR